MNHVVKIFTSDDGEPRDEHLQVWHLVTKYGDSPRTLCEGEAFGFGESSCEYVEKYEKRGGITCQKCISIIKKLKEVKF